MNHDAIASSLCGRYTALSENSGYLESIFPARGNGALLGAYIVARGNGVVDVTDDGDVLFEAIANGTGVTYSREKAYRKMIEQNGAALTDSGAIRMEAKVETLAITMARYFRAAIAVSDLAYKHRPSDTERFMQTIGEDLSRYGNRVTPRPKFTGLSGHQLTFHFGIDMQRESPIVVHTIAAAEGVVKWHDVYETGGKFKDAKSARSRLRLVAVLEESAETDKASNFLSDIADVYIYKGEPLPLAA